VCATAESSSLLTAARCTPRAMPAVATDNTATAAATAVAVFEPQKHSHTTHQLQLLLAFHETNDNHDLPELRPCRPS
jgi:hypothetical protein